jgi:cytochrome c-type biogenesis protein CcmH/NrfG
MGGSEKRDSVLGHRATARILSIQKKPELARKEFIDAIRENPASGKAHYYYAFHLEGQKDYKAALGGYESAAALGDMQALFRIGVVSVLSESNLVRGEEALKKYLTHTPDENEAPLARGWYWLGRVQEKLGRKADARASYAASLKLAPATKDVTEALKRVS